MNTMAWILGGVIAIGSGVAGCAKLADLDRTRDRLGYSATQYRFIGASEIAASLGILAGLLSSQYRWLAIASAVALGSLMLGALLAHARMSDDAKAIAPALALLVSCTAFVVLFAAS